MYHSAVHDARNNTLILVIQSQCYTLQSTAELVNTSTNDSDSLVGLYNLVDLAVFTPTQCHT